MEVTFTMPTDIEINDKGLVHDVKITNLENDMKEVKGEIKNLNDVWRTIDSLTTNLNALSEVVNRLSIDTNKSIQEVSELLIKFIIEELGFSNTVDNLLEYNYKDNYDTYDDLGG